MKTHYNSYLKLTIMKSQGAGACGRSGFISGYLGLIDCKRCRKLYEQDNKPLSCQAETGAKA